ncbi:TetR/AcrR family transcriptional regulator [Pseudonocardia acaciae]|uniref:TetR/AcrR family transcriptional regulator n=1 Tax=Pseudonocardia acaciae TaxID=551276 RepID=UPI000685085A|nr:TetR/AcrR family transcriptional regulator [Pseudonocardia acaciae]
MTENVNPVTRPRLEPEPDERLGRVLDAAAELLVRWGYRKVTVEDVAAAAGIGKGTVYLHFRTKEALFLTVLLRGYRGLLTGLTDRMRADPQEVLPGRMVRSTYLAVLDDPVARQMYLGDGEMLGRLAREAAGTLGGLRERGTEAGRAHLALLRDAGLLRTDVDLSAQQYLLDSVTSGFFFVESLGLPSTPADPHTRADLLEYAVAHALQVPGAPAPDAALAERVAASYDALLEPIANEWQRRVR